MNESISTRRTKEREDLNEQAGRNWLVTIARVHLSLNLQQLRKTISQVPELQIQIGGTRSRGHEHTQWRHGSQQGGGASFWQHALLVRRQHYILAANAPCKVAILAPCPWRRREARDGRWRWDTPVTQLLVGQPCRTSQATLSMLKRRLCLLTLETHGRYGCPDCLSRDSKISHGSMVNLHKTYSIPVTWTLDIWTLSSAL